MRLLETLEMHMISEVRKRVSKELTLALSERAREETALPTDLWKRAVSFLLLKCFCFRAVFDPVGTEDLRTNHAAVFQDVFPDQHLQ